MGPVVFDDKRTHDAPCFAPLDSEEFSRLCWAVNASAQQLTDIGMKAAIHGRARCSAEQQEAYVMMMLGPLAALDQLRRKLAGT